MCVRDGAPVVGRLMSSDDALVMKVYDSLIGQIYKLCKMASYRAAMHVLYRA